MLLELTVADWILVAGYFAALIFIGVRAKRPRTGTAADFILTGRSLTMPSFVAALVSTWYGGILGVGEYSYQYGLSNWIVFGAPYYVFALIFAFVFARRVRESMVLTIPDQLGRVYGRGAGLLGSLLVFFISSPAPYVLMQGVLLQAVTGYSLLVCVLMGTTLSLGLLLSGGFQTLVRVDLIQFLLMFLGFTVLLAFLVPEYGAFSFLRENLAPGMLSATGGHSWQYLAVWFFIAMWTLVSPQFHQFTLSAASPAVARRGIVLSVAFWFLFDAMTTVSGMYARALLPGLGLPSMAYPALAQLVLPPLAKGMFFLGMLATIMSTNDGLAFISAATIGKDVLMPLFGGNNETALTRFTRIGLFITVVFAVIAALILPSVVGLWYTIGTLFIPGLLLPLLTSYSRRYAVSPRMTLIAMAAGFLLSLSAYLWGIVAASASSPAYLLEIEPMYVGLSATVLIYLAAYVMRNKSRNDEPSARRLT